MGTSTNGILAYGFNLGGAEEGWKIEEAGKYGDEWVPEWARDDDDETGEDSIVEGAEQGLRAAGLSVEFEMHCSGDYPMYVLSAQAVTAFRGHPKVIDFGELETLRTAEEWDERLRRACAVLGIKPIQEQPQWLLVSLWAH